MATPPVMPGVERSGHPPWVMGDTVRKGFLELTGHRESRRNQCYPLGLAKATVAQFSRGGVLLTQARLGHLIGFAPRRLVGAARQNTGVRPARKGEQ